jgi:hypothetical protein
MNLVKTLRLFCYINDYVLLKFSNIDSTRNKIILDRNYVIDLMKLNNIIGRLELYVNDKKDKESAVYMVEWFKREMYARDFDYDNFMEWAEEYSKSNALENE